MKLDLKKLKLDGQADSEQTTKKASVEHEISKPQQLVQLFKKVRQEKKKTQEEIAVFADISRLAVNEFEKDKSDIRLSTLLKILKSCDLEMVIREK